MSDEAADKILVNAIRLTGNTLLSDETVASLVSPYAGREMTVDEIKGVAELIREAYRKQGYFLAAAFVLAQEIVDGTVEIRVFEGRLGELKIEGNRYYSTRFLGRQMRPVIRHSVLHEGTLRRTMALLNDFTDLNARLVLSHADSEEAGAVDMTLLVEDRRPWHVGWDYNNFGSRYTGENRVGLTLSAGNLTGWGDDLGVQAVYPFPSRSRPFFSTTYAMPVNVRGTKMTLSYSNSESVVGEELAFLDIRGEADVIGLTVTQALDRTALANADVSIGITSKSVRNTILGDASSQDELRLIYVGYRWDRSWVARRNLLSVTLTQGLGDALGGMEDRSVEASRAFARSKFTKLNTDGLWWQSLGKASLVGRASLQATPHALTSGEQYGVGGADMGRGFRQAEFSGDAGYAVSLEWRTASWEYGYGSGEGTVFVDHGGFYLKHPKIGKIKSRSLTGAGVGMNIRITSYFSLHLDWGFPLDPDRTFSGEDNMVYLKVGGQI